MNQQPLEISTKIQIQKPAPEVFEAIVNPKKMANYFISKGSGRLEEGKTVQWSFPEFAGEFPVRVKNVEPDKYVSFFWDAEDGRELLVEITLTPVNAAETLVTVTEKSRKNDEAGLKWLMGNSAGWANFLACLKAWLEYGINLRKGAFSFMAAAPQPAEK